MRTLPRLGHTAKDEKALRQWERVEKRRKQEEKESAKRLAQYHRDRQEHEGNRNSGSAAFDFTNSTGIDAYRWPG